VDSRGSAGLVGFALFGSALLPFAYMPKASSFLPFLISAASHNGILPRPAQVSDLFFGLRYLGATFLPFILLVRRLPPEFAAAAAKPPSPRAAS
jgi:hypothetical protein